MIIVDDLKALFTSKTEALNAGLQTVVTGDQTVSDLLQPLWQGIAEALKEHLDPLLGGGPALAVKVADTSRTVTTTLADDPDLALALEPGLYTLEAGLIVNAGTTPDIKVAWSSGGHVELSWSTDLNGNGIMYDETDTVVWAGAGADRMWAIRGTIEVTAADTLTLQWAQNTSDLASTTMRSRSWIRAEQIS